MDCDWVSGIEFASDGCCSGIYGQQGYTKVVSMNIKVRREVVRCLHCKRENEFLYLSDFSYGERLVLFDNGMKYAYINLLKDCAYSDFIHKVKTILNSHQKEILNNELQNIIDDVFVITCDKIQGSEVDFVNSRKKCIYCAAQDFDDLMVEPEKMIDIDVPNVTHEAWENMYEEKKMQLIENSLKKSNII